MVSPLLLMASQDPTRQLEATQSLIGTEEEKPGMNEKQKGKRASKSNPPAKKKQPQRGMGVAQLERLRIQERWKMMTETTPLRHFTLQAQVQPQISQSFGIPFGSGNVLGGFDGSGLNHNLMVQRVGHGCGVHGFDGVLEDPYKNNFNGGLDDPRFRVIGTVVETSKELSSIPKIQCPSGVCHKKKRTKAGSFGLISSGGRDKVGSASEMMNGCDFIGLNLGNNGSSNNGDQIKSFNTRATRSSGPNVDMEVEVMGIHRKESVGGKVLMEYDFLPSGRSSSLSDSQVLGTTSNNDTTLDLSLKL